MPEGNHVIPIQIVHGKVGALHALRRSRNDTRLPSKEKRWAESHEAQGKWQLVRELMFHGGIKIWNFQKLCNDQMDSAEIG